MAVIVRVTGSSKGGGSSASRYIQERELNGERESRETRQLFTAKEDNLTPWKADKFLAGDAGQLNKEDIHHLIISLLPEEYERLGDTDLARRAELVQLTREALEKLFERDLDGYESRWVAGLHLNTRLPHLHVLMHKEVTDPVTGEKKVLEKIPKELLAERGSTIRDEDPAKRGRISQRFQEALDEHSKSFCHIQVREVGGKTLASREVIEARDLGDRKPTFEEISVGRWVVAEAKAAHERGRDSHPPVSLREYVQKVDEHSVQQGMRPTAAFLSQEQISEMTKYRTSALLITLHTASLNRRSDVERPSREQLDRIPPHDEHERRPPQRARYSDEDQAQPDRPPKDGTLKERQVPGASGALDRATQIPRQAEKRNLPSPPEAGIEGNNTRFDRDAVDNGKNAYPRASIPTHPTSEASSRDNKLKAQKELFESRGRGLIEQYVALSTDPRQIKDFESAAKNQLEAERRVDLLVKRHRERYGEDAPAGAVLSTADRDFLINNVPNIRHLPSSVRNEFLRAVHAAGTSDHARSYLPRESRPFHDRRPARDNRKGGRGR